MMGRNVCFVSVLVFMTCGTNAANILNLFSRHSDQCHLSHKSKLDCGWMGITKDECYARGCCYEPCPKCTQAVPWCYMSTDMVHDLCMIEPAHRIDCGYRGQDKFECIRLGCCWKPTGNTNDKWCYRTSNYEPTTTTTTTTTPTTTTTTEQTTTTTLKPTTTTTTKPSTTTTTTTTTTTPPTTVRVTTTKKPHEYEGQVILYGGAVPSEGKVEIYHDGEWGTVCDDDFDQQDGEVLCRQMGYEPPTVEILGTSKFGKSHVGNIWFNFVNCAGDEAEILDCRLRCWGCHNCDHNEDVGIRCTGRYQGERVSRVYGNDGDVRLVAGRYDYEGRLEVYHDGRWGTVCDDVFDYNEGAVVCRQLGYEPPTAETFSDAQFGEGRGAIWLDDMSCRGDEENISGCIEEWGSTNCEHYEDAAVRCLGVLYKGNEGDVRLIGGEHRYEGRVEILHDDEWGSVCYHGFDVNDAKVVCRQLGHSHSYPYIPGAHSYGRGIGPVWLRNINCTGDETSLLNCHLPEWDRYSCPHRDDVGIICY